MVTKTDSSQISYRVANQPARDVQTKLLEVSISVNDHWAQAGTGGDDTPYLEAASATVSQMGGGVVRLKRGTIYRYTRLSLRSNVIFEGEGPGSTVLQCIDSVTLDAGVAHGSSIRKPDDGQRVHRAGFKNLWIGSGTSQVATLETTFQNIIGLNLCACERTVLENVSFAGFGQGAIVLARAEAGAEGLGFVNTTQDGNYNYFHNISIGSCGRYNADEAAIWFKYKANSNKFYSIFCKPVYVAFGLRGGNDNAFFGGSVESSKSISVLGQGSLGVSGNLFIGIRAEGLSSDAYTFLANAYNNTVLAGYHTGVTGIDFNLSAGPDNRVMSDTTNYLRNVAFPPVSSYSTLHNRGALRVSSIIGDPNDPLYIKSKDYATVGSYPYVVMYNDIAAGAAGNTLGRLAFRNGDSSAGAAGVSAAVEAALEGSGGQTALVFHTGTSGTTLTENLRLTNTGVLRPGGDNTQTLGAAANRWSVVYAGTGTINTSDEREKTDIVALDAAERRVAVALKGLVKKFRFRDAVIKKGDSARIHVGVIAQEVMSAFEAEGLDSARYGIICRDEWDEQVIEHEALYDRRSTGEVDEVGEAIHARALVREAWTEVRPAGNRYGVRYEELLAFIIAAL